MLCLFESSDIVAGGSIPEGWTLFFLSLFFCVCVAGELASFMFYMFTHKTLLLATDLLCTLCKLCSRVCNCSK